MIRNPRVYIAIEAVGAVAMLVVLAMWAAISPPTHLLFPRWFLLAIAAFVFGSFVYNIVATLRGRPIPRASWSRNLSDGQLWAIKGALIAGIIVFVAITTSLAFHRP